jgi:hypothetical protein
MHKSAQGKYEVSFFSSEYFRFLFLFSQINSNSIPKATPINQPLGYLFLSVLISQIKIASGYQLMRSRAAGSGRDVVL